MPGSLALDSDGNPHIIYCDRTHDDLRYAVKADGFWRTELVEYIGQWCPSGSIDIDSAGNPHILYHSSRHTFLSYAVKIDGEWIIERLDFNQSVGPIYSIAVDSAGDPHISYYDVINRIFMYAVKIEGAWSIEVVDRPENNFFNDNSLALDSAGNPHIIYQEYTFNQDNATRNADLKGVYDAYLKYAVKIDGAWSTEVVDSAGDADGYICLALDSSGNPHISYYDYVNKDLKYAVKSGGSWDIETVDSAGDVGSYNTIAVNTSGNVHIIYEDTSNNDLKYVVVIKNTTFTITPSVRTKIFTSVSTVNEVQIRVIRVDPVRSVFNHNNILHFIHIFFTFSPCPSCCS